MGTLNAVYVRANGASIEAAVEKIFPIVTVEAGESFIGLILPNDALEPPHDSLHDLSVEFGTDVIWLSFQSVVDAFQFHHWHDGSLLRSLVYGCYGDEERTWNRVDGDPETWEGSALFERFIDARETARKVARFYVLPGWS
jgi:hypothetical protein